MPAPKELQVPSNIHVVTYRLGLQLPRRGRKHIATENETQVKLDDSGQLHRK